MADLFSNQPPHKQEIAPGLTLFKSWVNGDDFIPVIEHAIKLAPLRYMMTPMGYASKVAMSNCGPLGWVSDAQGYQYSSTDPLSGDPWPALPHVLVKLAQELAQHVGTHDFQPDACLINKYEVGIGMGKHQDQDEWSFQWPIVSLSLGLSAIFQVSGNQRNGNNINMLLEDGDVLVMHGPARQFFHGIRPLKADPLQPTLHHRYNLTLRRAK
jgi:alkylated DNA repair protein (DNA oxidative demethylase)